MHKFDLEDILKNREVLNKIIGYLFVAFLSMALLYTIVGVIAFPEDNLGSDESMQEYAGEWYIVEEDGKRAPFTVPGRAEVKKGETVTLETILPKDAFAEGTYLCFRSGKQDMRFYIDDELRLTYDTKETRVFGNYSAVAYVFLKVSPKDAGKTLRFESTTASSYSGIVYTVYQGSTLSVWKHYFSLYGSELIVALVVLILSIIVIFSCIAMGMIYKREVPLIYLGIAVLEAGIWIIANSVFRQFIFKNLSVVNDLAFNMVMLLPIPFLLYFNSIQKKRYGYLCYGLEILALADFFVCTLLHISGIKDFADTFPFMALVCMTTILTLIGTMVIDKIRGYSKEYRLVVWGMVAAFSSAFVQIITYFQRTKTFSGVILAAGLILLIIFATISTVAEFIRSEGERQRALVASKQKSDFLANMSHEIRTPINAILGLNTMIQRESGEENIKQYSRDIDNAGNTLLSLINDVLDMSKIESGKMEIIPVSYDFSSLIYDIVNMVSIKAENKGLKIELDIDERIPSKLYGDDVRIRQILVNLINNSVKYTEKGSVKLAVTGDVGVYNAKLKFTVSDTGIGIKEEDLHKLFEKFARIEEERNRNIEGTGLGMSIIVKLLSLMDSKLDVSSVYGEGTSFSFELDQVISDSEPIGNLQARIENTANQKNSNKFFEAPEVSLLLVDDDAMNRRVFRGLFDRSGMDITEAVSGRDALSKLEIKKYDIVLLDYMMPDMNGVDVLKRLKENASSINISTPVIALTANAISGARDMYLEAGFDEYISKPIQVDKLEKLLISILPKGSCGYKKIEAVEAADTAMRTSLDTSELPMVDGVDWDYAAARLKDVSLLKEITEEYIRLSDIEFDNLKRLYENIEKEGIYGYRVKIHAMKNTLAMIGAIMLSSEARLLEGFSKEEKIAEIRVLMPSFMDELSALNDRLRSAFNITEDDGADKLIPDREHIEKLLYELKIAMEELDIDASDVIMEELSKYGFNEGAHRVLRELNGAVRNLDEISAKRLILEFQQEYIKEET